MFSGLSLLSKLFSPDLSPGRLEKDDPRTLIARAGKAAINQERKYLLNTFGFDKTIYSPEPAPIESAVAPKEKFKALKANRKETLI